MMSETNNRKLNIDAVGIDIQKNGIIFSVLSDTMNDPDTVMTSKGESKVFPLSISKEKNLGRWYIGDEALTSSAIDGAYRVDDLYEKAYEKEIVKIESRDYSYEELFSTYIRRIIEENGVELTYLKKLVISVPEVDIRAVELFSALNARLSLNKDVLNLIDHKESFMYYTLSQNQNIFAHDVALFDYTAGRILCYILNRNTSTRPQVIDIFVDRLLMEGLNKDEAFCEFANRVFEGRVITSVFLTGEGFDGDWMQESVELLCKNRRVFAGDNLYSKGAALCGRIKLNKRPWNYVYIGDHEMKMNLSLKVSDRNDMTFVTLVEAGENWYETGRECEVILDGTPQFECWIQSPESRQTKVTLIELKEMPKRENRTTRLRISAKPSSDVNVVLTIKDLGFGDIAPSTGRVWEHIIDMRPDTEVNNG